MRTGRLTTCLVALGLLASGSLAVAPAAHAGTASPAALTFDCSEHSPSPQSVTGAVGDTFTITNTAPALAGNECSFDLGYDSIVSGMSAVASGGGVETYTIVSSGSFGITTDGFSLPQGSTSLTVTAIEGNPADHAPLLEDMPSQASAVTAVPGVYSATVSWSPPSRSGAGAVTDYRVFSSPEGVTCAVSAPKTSCQVVGLNPHVSYTFYVNAISPWGWGLASGPSNAVTPLGATLRAPYFIVLMQYSNHNIDTDVRFENPTGRDLEIQFEYALCDLPCSSPAGLEWASGIPFGDTFGPSELSQLIIIQNPANKPVIIRARSAAFDGQVSDWAYDVPESIRALTPVVIDSVHADSQRAVVSWTDPTDRKWIDHYDVLASTRKDASSRPSDFTLVGSTTDTNFSYARQGNEGDQVRFVIRSVPNYLMRVSTGGGGETNSAPSSWSTFADVPTPRILDGSFGPLSPQVLLLWEPGKGPGAGNVTGFFVQTRDRLTHQWSSQQGYALDREAHRIGFARNELEPSSVDGIRIKALGGPGVHSSSWAYAVH